VSPKGIAVKPWTALIAAAPLLIAAAPASQRAARPAPDSALAVGTVIPAAHDSVVGGWRQLYRTHWSRRVLQANSVAETQECCIAVFEKGMALMVLRTEPVTRNARGEPLTERVVRSKWITRRRDETITDCQILYLSPALSLYDEKTEMIRSVAIDDGEFALITWRDPGSGSCAFGD